MPKDSKLNQRNFKTTLEQPIVLATKLELPALAKALVIDHGMDVNILSTDGFKASQGDNMYAWQRVQGQSLLDIVEQKLEQLRSWKPQEVATSPPKALEDDSVYLSKYQQRPYALWSAQKQLSSAKVNLSLIHI